MTKKFFSDTEFLEGKQKLRLFGIPLWETKPTIDLISIGIVTEDVRYEYYAISKEFNIEEAWYRWQQRTGVAERLNIKSKVYWLRDNVLLHIHNELLEKEEMILPFTLANFRYLIYKYGKRKEEIRTDILKFVYHVYECNKKLSFLPSQTFIEEYRTVIKNNPMEWLAYYGNYDWVVFCWIFGKMIDRPEGFPMFQTDLKQMFEDAMDEMHLWHKNQGHDLTREFLIESAKAHPNYPRNGNEHNALEDAKWNRSLYKYILSIKN